MLNCNVVSNAYIHLFDFGAQNYKKDRMENGIKGSRIWYNLR